MSDSSAGALATGTTDLTATLADGILTLTLTLTFNRLQARNALSSAMNEALQQQLAQAELDSAVKCVVLTGAGNTFCSGGDVKGMAVGGNTIDAMSIDQRVHHQRLDQRATAGKLFKMPKPTFAALPGPAAGAGLLLALDCDLRVMARTAILTTAFARVWYSGDYGGTYFLTQLVGSAKARELYFLSERVTADEAMRLGIVNWVCEPEAQFGKTRENALRLAKGPTVAYRYMKENLNRALMGDVDECHDL
jgi:2-(1,2-epoxy-1,2-dihydrophenyl)acetyl-CoA isomerase